MKTIDDSHQPISIEQTICLNMIVKNESHIIESTLKNILEHMKIDYWVISDTGSTDNTIEIIENFFKDRGISGEIFNDTWKDFGHNRTKALEHAFDKTDYIFIFDADDLIHGNINLPPVLDKDCYNFQFENPVVYHRSILISNRMRWKYIGVLHEYITPIDTPNTSEILFGNYHVESRRLGNRSKNPNKYLNDAHVLEKGFDEEVSDIWLKHRYAYYCGQSYKDCDKKVKSIEWYKKSLTIANNPQYHYCACINIGSLYFDLKQYSEAIDYWTKSYTYDRERLEGIAKIMEYYYNKGQHFMVSSLYNKFKHIKMGNSFDKIFLDTSKYHFFHYFASISGCYCDEKKSAYDACKFLLLNTTLYTSNTIYNLKFYMKYFKEDGDNKSLLDFFVTYIMNSQIDFKERENAWNIAKSIIKEQLSDKYEMLENSITTQNIDKNSKYAPSKNVLIYTGWMTHLWNESHLNKKALGGSEKAVAYLSRELSKGYNIIISGDVEEGKFDNRTYIHENKLQSILDTTDFHTIIISRNINFLTEFNNIKCYQLILSLHDTYILSHGKNANDILDRYNKYIDKVITLTPWHKSNISKIYPSIPNNKIEIINNGIDISQFLKTNKSNNESVKKIRNKFVWSSRTERGLHIVLNLWSEILEKLPDATLDICSYGTFPKDKEDEKMLEIINKHPSITYHGKLNTKELYDLMSISEYWLYTSTFPETSCITAMEMLMSGVICLYYPLAGLVDTVGSYGIQVKSGNEIESLIDLSEERKKELIKNGKEYALTCSWKNRANQWSDTLKLNKIWIFYCSPYFETRMIRQYIDNLNNIYPDYYIYLTNDKNRILTENPSKITFVYEVFDQLILNKLPNTQFSFLNTEPLNIPVRLEPIINILKLYPNLEYYDYSKSNLKILEENEINIQDKIYLPYKCSDNELKKLINLNKNTKKEFDFGILKSLGGDVTDRRLKIVDFLKENNFTVNIIQGWGDDRDVELAKCKIILNIHGFCNIPSNIFEHIRCDRLLESGFNILSESNYELDKEFANKYSNLKQISYDDFFNIDVINELYNNESKQTIKKIYDTLCLNKNPFEYYLNPVDIYEHLPTLYKYASKCNSVLECGVRSSVSSWALVHGLINNNSNNKKIILNDIEPCDVSKLLECTKSVSHLNISHEWISDLDLDLNENIDLTFIDTWHVGGHLKKELAKFRKLTNKYIIMHDTTVDEFTSEAIRANLSEEKIKELSIASSMSVDDVKMGLWPAIEEFLKNNNDWVLHERFTNNNGLTILKKVHNQPKIIDCFTFYNELDMLTYRLNILNDVVDYFVLVEATHTHVGKEKPLFYNENKQLFEKFNHKIIHIIVDDFSHKYPNINIEKEEQWINERYQRDCISRGINKLHLQHNDVITITDLDEIPNPKLLKKIKNNEIKVDINIIEMDLYYNNLNSKMDHQWQHSKILTFQKYNELNIGCDKIRFYNCPIIKNGGWHLSYFGNEKFIKNKIENFSHQEFNKVEFTDEKLIEERIKNGKDLFDRPTSIITIPIEDNDNLPPDYDIYLKDFYSIQYNSLVFLANKYGTDKISHDYIRHYEKIFYNIKDKQLNVLEIGIREGWSHLMWCDFFKYSKIYGIDNFSDPVFLNNNINKTYNFDRITAFIGDQTDEKFLNENITFDLDIIIDDGGHKMSHQQLSLKYLFKKLKPNGYYIIEDLHTSEWDGFLDVPNNNRKYSTLNFLKNIQNLNIDSHFIKGDELMYIQDNIKSINIYDNKLCIIQKKNYNVYVDGIAGLGNTLFQIATAIYYKEKYNLDIFLKSDSYEIQYGTSIMFNRIKLSNVPFSNEYITYDKTIFSKFDYYDTSSHSVIELVNDYTDNIIIPSSDIRIKGYCQNIGLFKEYIHKMPDYLQLNDPIRKNYIKSKYKNIENGVMIGVRIGDDFNHMKKLTRNSYIKALETLKHIGVNIEKLFIIADVDNAWEMFDLQNIYPATQVVEDDITQIYLGRMCSHFILSESTFHLWIAYLCNTVNKKVIVFKDTDITNRKLFLDDWIHIDY